jgi:hypothetical protein
MGPIDPALRIEGRDEMHDLVRATVVALDEAELGDLVQALHDRVFGCGADDLFETRYAGDVCEWRFKPMVELLLRHVLDVSGHNERAIEDRRLEIATTLDLAGF